ncbi:MAG: DUF2585 family protein [Tepidisphaerales bacterium]
MDHESIQPKKIDPASSSPRRRAALLWPGLAALAVVTAAVVQLRRQGRSWWCACGRPDLWWGDTQSAHNSQHLFDPYSLTHILHGIAFCGALAVVARRLSVAWRLCLAVSLAALWEVIENTDTVIERYRDVTSSFGYHGDTIANSLGDIFSAAVGFLLARRLGLWWSLVLSAAVEVVLLLWIRDSLLLNVVMLIHPIEAVKDWQMGG